MRKVFMFLAALFLAAAPAKAQSDYPSSEIFGGYAYMSSDTGFDRENMHGWGVSFAGNVSEKWGFVAEFSGLYGETQFIATDLDHNVTTFMFGPRYSGRSGAATGFAHVLVGGARIRIENTSATKLALAVGGGVDVNVSDNIAIRAVQADYLPIRSFFDGWTHNLRLQTGVVIKLGQ